MEEGRRRSKPERERKHAGMEWVRSFHLSSVSEGRPAMPAPKLVGLGLGENKKRGEKWADGGKRQRTPKRAKRRVRNFLDGS